MLVKDVHLPASPTQELNLPKHKEYLASYGTKKDDYEYCITEHLRMSGIYWGLTAMDLMGSLDSFDRAEIIDFVKQCQYSCGGFGASIHHDPHLLYTLSAVQILSTFDALNTIDIDKTVSYVKELQQEDGSFYGDKWGRPEKLPDVCYSWWVLASLKIIGRLHWIDKEKLQNFILASQDEETGGFGDRPGDMVDPFHTLFGLAGLSLLGDERLKPVNPVFCMSEEVVARLGVRHQLLSL
ncbi:hypothetical protein HPB50_004160 [Hyalomma asiaticum]|uniref:Uncharacterized protein n=1 Tax=Hyalomma asiaticum TaxID=266040 RepID=A0ACB7TC00_HYAAI|nr:hypothetical protein HPB50_004160 [Hyalomma asiaticum]